MMAATVTEGFQMWDMLCFLVRIGAQGNVQGNLAALPKSAFYLVAAAGAMHRALATLWWRRFSEVDYIYWEGVYF